MKIIENFLRAPAWISIMLAADNGFLYGLPKGFAAGLGLRSPRKTS